MKQTIEIDDTLQERVDEAIEEVRDELLDYLKENEPYKLPCLYNDLDHFDVIHDIIDGSVPIYTKEINDTWYLYSSELERAYEGAGIGNNPRENDGMAAIYCYIRQKVDAWYHKNAQEIFDEWQESRQN